MQPLTSIPLMIAVLAYASSRLLKRLESGKPESLKWWQKLAGIVAFMAVVMIAINPEFLALGLLGDTAFFDLFVLLLSLQLQFGVGWAWNWGGAKLLKIMRWVIAPSPCMSYLLVAWAFCIIGGLVSAINRFLLRISS